MTITSTPITDIENAAARHHSAKIIEGTTTWIDGLDIKVLSDIKPLLKEFEARLTGVSIEASFLGFCRTVRVTHAIYAAAASVGEGPLAKPQVGALSSALRVLKALVVSPFGDFTAEAKQVVAELQTQFKLNEQDLSEPFCGKMEASPEELTTSVINEQSLSHRDLDVYRSSRLDSLDQCREEETWIVSQLAALAEDLASGTHSAHPATRLMHVLKGHKFFSQVDRVCLAGRVAHANQLVVIDASISGRCTENSLKKGYSCFVNPEGSLFKMRPGTMRIFADSDRVLSSFAHQQKPAQRSIALIADQGLRSGLCLAIGRGDVIQGFLFLNSLQPSLFENITVQFAPLLSLFGLVATIALDTNGFHVSQNDSSPYTDWLPKTAIRFDQQEFLALVERGVAMLRGPDTKIDLSIVRKEGASDFLYLPSTIVSTVADLIVRTRVAERTGKSLQLNVVTERGEVRIEFEHKCQTTEAAVNDWLNHTVRTIASRFANKPIKVQLTETHAVLAFPFEPLLFGSNQLLYSTVY
jgi:hypothetical protein